MALIIYRYHGDLKTKEFDTFNEMREFAKNRQHNGRYHIISPLRHVSYRREQIIDFGLDEEQARECDIQDTRE